ncbi:NADH-quinone oxidoreductase subunit N (NADH dehydrogenase I subunit N) (NDH-1 subunit N) [Durusdinium trenchii]|uniref:NADH-quinone oxidoreductase subunit N (NADH dehydrogenase I subunit N) (NDH-1 subunit N) n=1 Tax=Durusdinium trenchii TaxID=1381693 RepID=A0ABP0SL61_9DINO
MSVHTILMNALGKELPRSLEIFTPELTLCATIVALLLLRLVDMQKNGLLAALYNAWQVTDGGVGLTGPYFTGLLVHDEFALFFRLGLSLFLVLVVALTVLTGIPDQEDGQDFYTLLFGATIGMLLATGANNLLMLFLSVEMMSVPSYAMVGFLKGKAKSSEAAFKYVVYGAGTAGIMLYGVSLLAGLLGTLDMGQLGERFALLMGEQGFGLSAPISVVTVLGILMVLVGLAFKLSLVPFHFWCPDAFEGASAEVGGFLSVASKAAAFALLVRFVMAFQGSAEVLHELSLFFGIALGVCAAASMTFGNLAAYTQDNVKRLLAYSTIAHAGYMLMAISALLVILSNPVSAEDAQYASAALCVEGLMYYIAVYLFMNLAAFAVVALVRNETYREDIEGFNGLISCNTPTKVLCICMAFSFFSLVGMPPFGGFFAKMLIFYGAFQAGTVHWFLWALLAIGGVNTVFSLFYYLRVLKAMFIAPRAEESRPVETPAMVSAYVVLLTIPLLALGASPLQQDLSATARYVATVLFQ